MTHSSVQASVTKPSTSQAMAWPVWATIAIHSAARRRKTSQWLACLGNLHFAAMHYNHQMDFARQVLAHTALHRIHCAANCNTQCAARCTTNQFSECSGVCLFCYVAVVNASTEVHSVNSSTIHQYEYLSGPSCCGNSTSTST